jgi:hypothetical protein
MPTLTEFYASAEAAYESVLLESPDRCSIYDVDYVVDASGGTTPTDGVALVSNLPVLYEETTDQAGQLVGGALSEVTHRLYFADSATTRGIKPNYAIVVASRSNNPERRFEHPIILEGSMEVGVTVAATIKL